MRLPASNRQERESIQLGASRYTLASEKITAPTWSWDLASAVKNKIRLAQQLLGNE